MAAANMDTSTSTHQADGQVSLSLYCSQNFTLEHTMRKEKVNCLGGKKPFVLLWKKGGEKVDL